MQRREVLLVGEMIAAAEQALDVAATGAEQFRSPRRGRDPHRDQRPITMRPKLSEQPVEELVGDGAGDPLGDPRPIQPHPLVPKRIHRVVMSVCPPTGTLTRQRERIDHRPRADVAVEAVEDTQHRLRVRPRRRRISPARPKLAGHRIRHAARPAATGCPRSRRLLAQHEPPAEVACLHPRRLIPPRWPTRTGTIATGPSRTTAASPPTDPRPVARSRTPLPTRAGHPKDRSAGPAPTDPHGRRPHPPSARPASTDHVLRRTPRSCTGP